MVVDAPRSGVAWRALLDVDLLKLGREAPLVGMLGALRMLPEVVGHLLHGERPAKPPESMRLRDLPNIPMSEGGWILLGERPEEEIALGLVIKFWRPVIEFARIGSADEFRDFEEPGFAKTVYALSVRQLKPNRTLALRRDANGDDRRARTALVSPVLDVRGRLRGAYPRRLPLGSARREAEGNAGRVTANGTRAACAVGRMRASVTAPGRALARAGVRQASAYAAESRAPRPRGARRARATPRARNGTVRWDA